MALILFTADWHIKLNRSNIPNRWQIDRTLEMVDYINKIATKYNVEQIIIGGDILDVSNPSPDELELYFEAIARLKHNTLIYTGNHEMVDNKHSCLFNIAAETNRCNNLVHVVSSMRTSDYDIIDYTELKKDNWEPRKSKLCFTHVRGAIPPHVKPEINLSRFEAHGYEVVYAGDLHSYSCTQEINKIKLMYPGSPFNTSFSRNLPLMEHGVFIIDTKNPVSPIWVELKELPQLLRKTVENPDEMIAGERHRIIYELVGDLVSLGKVKKTELLDKKINLNVTKDATLKGLNGDLSEEVQLYCREILHLPEGTISELLTELASVVDLEQYST